MRNGFARIAAASAVLLAAAGCGSDTARTFGFTRDAPDEFQVTTRAPLSMPPALGELPAPRPGADRPQELSQRQAAEAALVPGAALGQPGSSAVPAPGRALAARRRCCPRRAVRPGATSAAASTRKACGSTSPTGTWRTA